MRTGNPVLNSRTFENFGLQPRDLAAESVPATTMTVTGTANRTMFLLALAFCSACFTWSRTFNAVTAEASSGAAMPWVFGGLIVGFITAIVICFKQTWAPMLAPVYALAEGLFLGGISASFEAQYPGIVIQAVGGMFGFPIPFIHSAGPLGIGFSVVVVIIAALNLVLDFDFIETAAKRGAPKYLEWYGAFALMVTLVWLYLEILRLLSKLNSRN